MKLIQLPVNTNTAEEIDVNLSIREIWAILKQLYPGERWYQLLVRFWNLKTKKITPRKSEIPIDELHAGLMTKKFGEPGATQAGEYTQRGKVIKPPVRWIEYDNTHS